MKYIYISLIICAIAIASCKTSKKVSAKQIKSGKDKNKKFTEYQEDLSVLRPSYRDSLSILNEASTDKERDTIASTSIIPKHDITTKLNNFLEAVAEQEEEYDIRVYTLQIYIGNDRQKANYIRNKANKIFADSKAKILFDSPFYKVRMGEFTERIKAGNELEKAQKVFNSVSLIRMQLDLDDFKNKSL